MLRRTIRDIRSNKPVQPRICDVEADNGKAVLIWKDRKNEKQIRWEDMKHQVEAAIEDSRSSTSK